MTAQEKYNAPFPTNLRDLLCETNTTITALSKILGISRQAVSQYQDGTGQPNVEKLMKIAEYFNVSIDWLVGRKGSVKSLNPDEQAVGKYTGLSDEAIRTLHLIEEYQHGQLGVSAKGYTISTLDVLDELISSSRFLNIINELSLFLVYGGALPAEAYNSNEKELSVDEYERFYSWASGRNLEIVSRKDIRELHLEKACDELKNIFREMLDDQVQAGK